MMTQMIAKGRNERAANARRQTTGGHMQQPIESKAFAAPGRSRAAVAGLVMAVAMATALGGCRDHEPRLGAAEAAALNDPARRHPIGFSSRTEALYVEVASDGLGLSDNQATDVHRFLDRYRTEASGRLSVSAPASVKGHMATSRSLRDIDAIVERAGLPDGVVERSRTRGGDRYGPAVRLSYERPTAVAPSCGSWPEDMGRVERERLPYENFGCATQRNLAMTVATSRDLQVPQTETPRSSEVRSAAWSKYTGAGGPKAPVAGPNDTATKAAPKAMP